MFRVLTAFLAIVTTVATAQSDGSSVPSALSVLQSSCAAQGFGPSVHGSLHVRSIIDDRGQPGFNDELIQFRPLAYSDEMIAGDVSRGEGFAGGIAWTRDDSGSVRQEEFPDVRATRTTDAFIAARGYCNTTPVTFKAAYADTTTQDNAYRVRVSPNHGVPFDLWIDHDTRLPTKIVVDDWTRTTIALSDYRRVGTIFIPYHRSTALAGKMSVEQATLSPNDTSLIRYPQWSPDDAAIVHGTNTTIPFRFADNEIWVEATVNGRGPFRFVFDSGGRNVITSEVAGAIGAAPSRGNIAVSGAGSGTGTARYARVSSIQLGDAVLSNQTVLVYDGLGTNMLGYELLKRFTTTIDYAHRTMTLSLIPLPPGTGTSVAFNDTIPMVRALAGGVEGWFQVDTGSGRGLTLASAFATNHQHVLGSAAGTLIANDTAVPGSTTNAHLSDIDSLVIGSVRVPKLLAFWSTDAAGGFALPGTAGNIGNDVLQRLTVTFDYRSNRIDFVPNQNAMQPDRSGLMIIDDVRGLWVAYVEAGSPAAQAGLQRGDVIRKLDGRDVSALRALQLTDELNAGAGRTHALTVERDKAVMTMSMTAAAE